MILDEDLFDDIELEIPQVTTEVVADTEIEPEGPEVGEDTGIANLIHELLIDENEAIQKYNDAVPNMEKYPELQKIMQDIAGEEFAHIGELQKTLEIISPNASNIQEGEAETIDTIESTENKLEEPSEVTENLNEAIDVSSDYTIITPISVYSIDTNNDAEVQKLMDAQVSELANLGYTLDSLVKVHYLNTNNESSENTTIQDAIEALPIKDGVDLVQFDSGNYGFVAYYNGTEAAFEILGSADEELDESINISDDLKVLRVIDKAIKTSKITANLSLDDRRELANLINEFLHDASQPLKRSR